MTLKDKSAGKIARITSWKTGKGYFLNLDDDSNDYYGFGPCKAKVNETVELEVSEGTGSFADKVKIDKLHSKATVKEAVKETADKDMEILNKSIASGENTYFERQNLIIRQTCMKAAAVLVAAWTQHHKEATSEKISDLADEVANRHYAWVTEADYKLPEPPEEP